jgi:hypothetical protein
MTAKYSKEPHKCTVVESPDKGVVSMRQNGANTSSDIASFPFFIGGTKRGREGKGRKGSCLVLILSLATLLILDRVAVPA